jgi:hypothetical protein
VIPLPVIQGHLDKDRVAEKGFRNWTKTVERA